MNADYTNVGINKPEPQVQIWSLWICKNYLFKNVVFKLICFKP